MKINNFFKPKGAEPPSTSTSKPEDNPSSSTITSESAPSTSTSKTQGVLPSSITKTDTLQAKILWCLKVVEDHQSFHSCLENLTPRRLRPTREANKTQTRDPLSTLGLVRQIGRLLLSSNSKIRGCSLSQITGDT